LIPTTAEYERDEKDRALLAERALARRAELEARLAAREGG
jgi:hypothetical protein